MTKISIVDDDPDQRRLFQLALTSKGFDVIYTAADGAEAMRKNWNTPADIIIMNYMMPGMDGLEATERILNEFPKTQIIMNSRMDIEKEALKAGATRFLKCPVSLKEMIKVVGDTELFIE